MHLLHTSSLDTQDLLTKSACVFLPHSLFCRQWDGQDLTSFRHNTSTQIATVERTHYRFPLIPWEMTPRSDSVTVGVPTTKSVSPSDKKHLCFLSRAASPLYTLYNVFVMGFNLTDITTFFHTLHYLWVFTQSKSAHLFSTEQDATLTFFSRAFSVRTLRLNSYWW